MKNKDRQKKVYPVPSLRVVVVNDSVRQPRHLPVASTMILEEDTSVSVIVEDNPVLKNDTPVNPQLPLFYEHRIPARKYDPL